MASLKAIRKRVTSVRNTQQITKAMKMVSAAKLRRAQDAVVQSRAYSEKLDDSIFHIIETVVVRIEDIPSGLEVQLIS